VVSGDGFRRFRRLLSRHAIAFRPAAVRLGPDKYAPAVVCCDRHRNNIAVLTRSYTSTRKTFAADASDEDVALSPRGPNEYTITKERLVYLYGVGYRPIPHADTDAELTLYDDLGASGGAGSEPLPLDKEVLEEFTHETPEIRERVYDLLGNSCLPKSFERVLQIKLTLANVRRPAWRRIQVPSGSTFWDLYVAIQNAMQWHYGGYFRFVVSSREKPELLLGIEYYEYGKPQAAWQYPIMPFFSISDRCGSS
jgi:hypothetical protein